MAYRIFAACALAATVLVGGCATKRLQKCPAVSVLVDTSTLTILRESPAPTPPSADYTAKIVNATRDCDVPKYGKRIGASVDIAFSAVRANAGPAASYVVPYYVAITSEGKILAKRVFSVRFGFATGARTVSFSDSVNSLSLTVGVDKQPNDYGILVGFQLTKAQLDYNRRAGRYPR